MFIEKLFAKRRMLSVLRELWRHDNSWWILLKLLGGPLSHRSERGKTTAALSLRCCVAQITFERLFTIFFIISIIHWLLFYVLLGTGRCGSVHPPQPSLSHCQCVHIMLFLVQIETLKLSSYKRNLVQNLFYLSSPHTRCELILPSFWQKICVG